jgi:hypothetical protein
MSQDLKQMKYKFLTNRDWGKELWMEKVQSFVSFNNAHRIFAVKSMGKVATWKTELLLLQNYSD